MNAERVGVVLLTVLGHMVYGWIGAMVGIQVAIIVGGLLPRGV